MHMAWMKDSIQELQKYRQGIYYNIYLFAGLILSRLVSVHCIMFVVVVVTAAAGCSVKQHYIVGITFQPNNFLLNASNSLPDARVANCT